MPITRRDALRILAALTGAPALAPAAFAQAAYPSRPVRMVVPFAAGGPADIVGRIVAQHLSELLGQQFYVDNRAGAGGVVGAETVVRAAPDGHTLLFSSNTAFSVTPAIKKNLPFDVKRDIAVISPAAQGPQVLVVRSSLGIGSLQELLARARREPGKFTIAHSGVGSIIHFVAELFIYHAGVQVVQVPYRGGGPSVLGLLAGDVDMMINDLSPILEHIRAGNLKALAVASQTRTSSIPDTPTFPEAGLPQVISSSWFCLGAPSATPPDVIKALSAAMGRVLHLPPYRTRLVELGLEPFELSPPDATAFIARELEKWERLVELAKIQAE
jgi:tripartite-type tricarboxylate transporter receptor subunit TctC